jgi:hypothetical protein
MADDKSSSTPSAAELCQAVYGGHDRKQVQEWYRERGKLKSRWMTKCSRCHTPC